MNLSDIEIALRRYGFDSGDPLLQWINASYHEFENAYAWPWLEGTYLFSTSVGVGSYAVPGDFFKATKLVDLTDATTSGGEQIDLIFYDRRKWQREIFNHVLLGQARFWTMSRDDSVLLHPVPDTIRNMQLDYRRNLDDLTDPTDVPAIPPKFHYTIVRGAAYIALQAENEQERASVAMQEFQSDLDKAIEAYSERQDGEPASVEDVQGYIAR